MKSSLIFLLTFGTLFFLASCSKEDDKPESKVMITHASPDAPAVDLLLDNQKVNTNVGFPANTGYLTVEAGTRNIKVNAAGTTSSVINADVAFEEGKNYSVFAIDSVKKISAIVVEDDLSAPASGKAHVRFLHLSPNAPGVDVGLRNGATVFSNVGFKQGTAFTPLDAGTYKLDVRVAGTSTVALALPDITLEAGKIYTVWAKGFLGGTGVQSLGAEIQVNK